MNKMEIEKNKITTKNPFENSDNGIPEEYCQEFVEHYTPSKRAADKRIGIKNYQKTTKTIVKDAKVKYKGETQNKMYNGAGYLYHPTGKLKYYGNFKDGEIHQDNCVIFYMSGNKMFEGKMENGKKQGICREFHFNGRLKCEELFVNDLMEGDNCTIFTSYDNKDNQMKYDSGFVVFNDLRKTMVEEKDQMIEVPSGTLETRKAVFKGQFKKGKRQGFGLQFYEQTQCLEYIGFYNEDLPDSNFAKMYHAYDYYAVTEPPKIENIYELCEEVFLKQNFDENLKSWYIDVIQKNLRGLGVQYIKRGHLRYEGGLKNSLWEGPGNMYSPNGNLHIKGGFCRNKAHGDLI